MCDFKVFAVVVLLFYPIFCEATAEKQVALVWSGRGVCREGCAQAAADVAIRAGFEVQFVNGKIFSDKLLTRATLWIQPGGDAIEASQALGEQRMAAIRRFVANGGRYIGFCAGAFLSDHWVDDNNSIPGLGITPVETMDYAKDVLGKNSVLLPVNWEGKLRQLYFSEGATIKNPLPQEKVKIIAMYSTPGLPQTPAAWENTFGDGKVVVTGVHPEAPRAWKQGLTDHINDDFDLAQEMVSRAMRVEAISQ